MAKVCLDRGLVLGLLLLDERCLMSIVEVAGRVIDVVVEVERNRWSDLLERWDCIDCSGNNIMVSGS